MARTERGRSFDLPVITVLRGARGGSKGEERGEVLLFFFLSFFPSFLRFTFTLSPHLCSLLSPPLPPPRYRRP